MALHSSRMVLLSSRGEECCVCAGPLGHTARGPTCWSNSYFFLSFKIHTSSGP